MTQRKKTPREPRHPPMTSRGVRLTSKLAAEYEEHFARRRQTNRGEDYERIEALALADTFHPYRASTRAKGVLHAVFWRLFKVGLAVGALKDWSWQCGTVGPMQLRTLDELIEHLNGAKAELRDLRGRLNTEYRQAVRQ